MARAPNKEQIRTNESCLFPASDEGVVLPMDERFIFLYWYFCLFFLGILVPGFLDLFRILDIDAYQMQCG